ncbi:adenylate/guanylate cyclase domain-containing protein [Azospirillum sp. TSO22-1]|uniref:ATP-binding protein n=1 Tax=Azospirillum sp. TSO22-1 TaxID=716789 RepID=UPI001304AA94|nr:adenylate/guanylate cyclase domain-containing protein [Azospirillum sp. TSO22-1]
MMASKAEQQAMRRTGAERKLVSVMFADIVGSSAMVSGRDPEDADRALRAVLAVLTGAVERYKGTIGQMLGDGVLAIFGAPHALEEHALRACLAAQDIRTAALAPGSGFAVRIGIASGEVLAQVIEHGVWSDYRTVGECVHLAAKLQQKAEPNSVLLSHDTVELVPAGLTVQPAGQLRLSAETEPYPAFALASVRAGRRTAADLMTAATGPFVGRQRERETLLAAYEAAGDGFGTVVLLSGEAGIGKSRLVGETLRMLPDDGHALLQWPQAPIRRLGAPEDLEQVAAGLLPLAGGHDPLCAAAERTAGPLARAAVRDLLGLPVADRVWTGLQPAEQLSTAIDALAGAIVALGQERTILILVEDVHWASPVMRRLLDAVTRALTGAARILFIATARPESGSAWTPEDEALSIRLDPLPPEPTQEYLNRWLGTAPSLHRIKGVLIARSQGVPLYLEESLRALETAGAIVGVPGRFQPGTDVGRIDLPASVHGLLAARIDSLNEELRRTLLTAAVIGPSFDVALLRRQGTLSEAELSRQLAELEGGAFVRRSRLLPNLEYSFRHGLVQEVAYATITRGDRRLLHAQVLEALCERRDHDLPGRIELMAHHAFQAEIWPAAYAYGRVAGRRAEQRSKLEEASRHYGNALAAIDQMPDTRRNTLRRIDMSIALPRALLPRGVTGVNDHLTHARHLALAIGDRARFAQTCSVHAAFEWAHGDIDNAIRLSREGIDKLGNAGCVDTRVQLLCRLGGALTEKGFFPEATSVLDEAARLIDTEHVSRRHGMAIAASVGVQSILARIHAETGNAAAALKAGTEAVETAEESGHALSKVYANEFFGWALLLLGEAERSVPALESALNLCELTRSRLHMPLVMGALGYARVLLGEEARGLELLDQGLNSFRQQGTKHRAEVARIWRAEALIRLGRPLEALDEAERALQLARATGRLAHEARASFALAEAAWAAGCYDAAAAEALRNAHTLAQRLSMAPLADLCANGFGKGTRARSAARP